MVTTKVKAKLFDDNIMRGASISVDTFEGYVTLTGDKDMFQVLNLGGQLGAGHEHVAPAKPSQKEKSQDEVGQHEKLR